jgi:hypothetical protein
MKKTSKRALSRRLISTAMFPHENPHYALMSVMKDGKTFIEACTVLGFDPTLARQHLLSSDEFKQAIEASVNEERAMAVASYASLRSSATQCLMNVMIGDPSNREAIRAASGLLRDLATKNEPSINPPPEDEAPEARRPKRSRKH